MAKREPLEKLRLKEGRGKLLTGIIIFQGIIAAIAILVEVPLVLIKMFHWNLGAIVTLIPLLLWASSLVAIWKWQKLGAYGFALLILLILALDIMFSNYSTIGSVLLGSFVIFWSIRPKWHLFE